MDPKLESVKAEIKDALDEMKRITEELGETKDAWDRLRPLKERVDKLVNDYLSQNKES